MNEFPCHLDNRASSVTVQSATLLFCINLRSTGVFVSKTSRLYCPKVAGRRRKPLCQIKYCVVIGHPYIFGSRKKQTIHQGCISVLDLYAWSASTTVCYRSRRVSEKHAAASLINLSKLGLTSDGLYQTREGRCIDGRLASI